MKRGRTAGGGNRHRQQLIGRGGAVMALVLAVLVLLGPPAWGREGTKRVTLDFYGSIVEGQRREPATLYLKKELMHRYQDLDVSQLLLHKVVLVARVRGGRGQVQLRVGPEMSDRHHIGGSGRSNPGADGHGYSRVVIDNPFRQSWGPWHLYLHGSFRVDRVILEVENRHR